MGGFHIVLEAAAQGTLLDSARQKARLNWDGCVQTFQSYMQFKEIPRKLVVSKRLAQCLNPALPTGVHQRALDVYTHILSVLGVRRTVIVPHQSLTFRNVSPKGYSEISHSGLRDCSRSFSMLQPPSRLGYFTQLPPASSERIRDSLPYLIYTIHTSCHYSRVCVRS